MSEIVQKLDGPTFLYRHFDESGKLLYVGVSISAIYRLGQHRDHSSWFDKIARVEIEKHPTRSAALAAETAAIKNEKPAHNIQKRHVEKPEKPKHAEFSRAQLVGNIVGFDAMYTPGQAAARLGIPVKRLKEMIAVGEIGSVRVDWSKQNPIRMTGWQLIEYIEGLQGSPA